jgi:hypothetical protein
MLTCLSYPSFHSKNMQNVAKNTSYLEISIQLSHLGIWELSSFMWKRASHSYSWNQFPILINIYRVAFTKYFYKYHLIQSSWWLWCKEYGPHLMEEEAENHRD